MMVNKGFMNLRTAAVLVFVFTALVFVIGCGQSNGGGASDSYQAQMDMIKAGNDALNKLDWEAYAGMIDPASLENFRGLILPGVQKLILQNSSDSVNLFGQNFSSDVIQNEPADSFFVDIMNMAVNVSPDLKNTFSTMTNDNLGAIGENDTLVHVVTRAAIKVGEQNFDELDVYTLKKVGDDWKMVMSPKIEGIAFMIRNGLPQ